LDGSGPPPFECRLIDQAAVTHAIEFRLNPVVLPKAEGKAEVAVLVVGRMIHSEQPKRRVPDSFMHDADLVRRVEARLRDTLDALADGILVTDSQDIITYFNRAASELFGYSPLHMIGKGAEIILPVRQLREEQPDRAAAALGMCGRSVTLQKEGRPDVTVVVQVLPFATHAAELRGTIYLLRHVQQAPREEV
jgi:PAS domain S-box-containing protein